jgi:hypothetical protein
MLDLRMNGSVGDNLVRTLEVVLAVDMLLVVTIKSVASHIFPTGCSPRRSRNKWPS